MYKAEFPIFDAHPSLVYLDSAATAHKPRAVIEAVGHFYAKEYGTVHRGIYPLAVSASEKYEAVRGIAAQFLGIADVSEVIFTAGATDGLNLLANGLGAALTEEDEIILSSLEHHANLVPWQQTRAKIQFAPLTEAGEIDLEKFPRLISSRTKIVSLSLCSNVLGTAVDLPSVKKMLEQQGSGAILIADASQAAPHFPLRAAELGADFIVFSGHKAYGPSGTGILWGRKPLLDALPPYRTGGDMIRGVTFEGATWNHAPWKFEAGTPNIEGVIGLGAALEWLMAIGMDTVAAHAAEITQRALEKLRDMPEVRILSQPDPKSGIVPFVVSGVHPHDVAEMLGEKNVCIRAGHHCAAPLHDLMGIPASNRISIGIYTEEADIDALVTALRETIAYYA